MGQASDEVREDREKRSILIDKIKTLEIVDLFKLPRERLQELLIPFGCFSLQEALKLWKLLCAGKGNFLVKKETWDIQNFSLLIFSVFLAQLGKIGF